MATRKTRKGKTDWNRLEHLGDAEIRKAAKADPDAAPVASSEWFRRAKLLEPQPKTPISMPERQGLFDDDGAGES